LQRQAFTNITNIQIDDVGHTGLLYNGQVFDAVVRALSESEIS